MITNVDLESLGSSDDDKDTIDSVLRRLPAGVWGEERVSLQVLRRLSGLGGATVLEIKVRPGAKSYVRVVKIGPVAEMRREYAAYTDVIKPLHSELFPPIETGTSGAVDAGARPAPDGLEAVVYTEVGQFVGEPGATLTTLEDVLTAASLGDRAAAERGVEAITSLFVRAGTSLYNGPKAVDPAATLVEMVGTLGPDVVVDVDHLSDAGRTVWRDDTQPFDRGKLLYERTVWRAGAVHQGPGSIAPGTAVTIDGLRLEQDGDAVVGRLGNATVELLGVPPGLLPSPSERGTFGIGGRIVSTRPQTVLRRMSAAINGLADEGAVVTAPGVRARHPCAALSDALAVQLPPVSTTRVHGDLNSRNVLLVNSDSGTTREDRPYVIDYARSRPSGQLLVDFAWLEINLMRALGGEPDLARLIRLQRLITVAARLLPAPNHDPALDRFDHLAASLDDAGLALAWPALLRLRWEAVRCYGQDQYDAWFADYTRHLVLAAHRTFKWPDGIQSPTRWAASTAVAAVAGEWLGPYPVFRHWPDEDLALVARTVSASARTATRPGAMLLGRLTSETGRRARQHVNRVEDTLTEAANALAAAVFRPKAAPERGPFMDLSVQVSDAAEMTPRGEPVLAVEALADVGLGVLVGPAGSGKTTVVREAARRMQAVAGNPGAFTGVERHRLPVVVPAYELLDTTETASAVVSRHAPVSADPPALTEDLLRAGCLHVFVDGAADPADTLVGWAAELRRDYPRTPVLVCLRSDPDPAWDSPVYRLLPPEPGPAMRFLTESAIRRDLPVSVIRDLVGGRGTPRIDELFRTPMGLALLAEHLRPHNPVPSLADLLDHAFPGLHGSDRAWRIAGCLAAGQVDRGTSLTPEAQVLEGLAESDRASWPGVRDLLLEHGVLQETAGDLSFGRQVYRDYFAGLNASEDDAALPDRALRLAWQEPLRLAVSRRSAPAGLSAKVLGAVRHADAEFAGRLLAMASGRDDEGLRSFARDQEAVLRDPGPGRVEQQAAVRALCALGGYGVRRLCAAADDGRLSVAVRLTVLRTLRDDPAPADPEPVRLAARLLGDPSQPAALRATAAEIAVRYRAVHLAVLIADGCDDRARWSYVDAARKALLALGAPAPRRLRTAFRTAAGRRLEHLVRILPRLTTRDAFEAAQRERVEILRQFFRTDADRLLEHRFAFEIGEVAADLLEHLPASTPAAVRPGGFDSGDERAVRDAAHRLLRDTRDSAGELIAAVRPGDPPVRLLAAATAASVAGVPALGRLEELVGWLGDQPHRTSRENEALAALLTAVHGVDRLRGAQLAGRLHAALAASGSADRLRWPVLAALARCTPRFETCERLLASVRTRDRELAVEALASAGFHLDASPPPRPPVTGQTRQALLGLQPATGGRAAVDFVRAAATAGLTDCLPFVDELLADDKPDRTARSVSHSRYGVLSLTGRSEILPAAGFLARQALLAGESGLRHTAATVAGRIRAMRPEHPGDATGRLIALAYLGDAETVLRGLDGAQARLHTAARHAVLTWAVDGPLTGPDYRDPERAHDAIAALLTERRHDRHARSTLLTVLWELSRRTGRLAPLRPHGPM